MSDINVAITKEEIEEDDIPQQIISKINKKINIITLPTIITIPIYSKDIANSIKKIENGFYDYYIFLSARSVDIFFKTIKNEKNSSNILQEILKINKKNGTFIAIGPKTKKALEKNNLKANIAITDTVNTNIDIKVEFSLHSIMKFLDNLDKNNEKEKIKILMPRSAESQKSNNFIKKTYENLVLEQIFFYKTIEFNKIEESNEWNKFKSLVYQKELKYLIFTSPSAVRAFFKIVVNSIYVEKQVLLSTIKNEQELVHFLGIKLIISLGPRTSEELKKRDIMYLESTEYTVKGALKYLIRNLAF
ncbi:MAG: uroporphyrinogen-III synthase [Nitrosopumilus sp.]|nr:uroporphyrinogen-III synthase [Nitrosopumilus sp.]